jgi:hypothetical protein
VPCARLAAKSFANRATLRRSMIPGDVGHSIIPSFPASNPDHASYSVDVSEVAREVARFEAAIGSSLACFLAALTSMFPLVSAGDAFISQGDSRQVAA